MSKSLAAHLRYEKGLLSPVRLWLSAQGFVTLTEFRVPWGICDLVGLHPNISKARDRIDRGQLQPIGDMESFMVLETIPSSEGRRSAMPDEIASALREYLSPSRTSTIVDKLYRRGYLEKTRTGGFRKILPWFPYHSALIAIELKLLRVEEALKQAINHKAITQHCYVAFPAELAEKVKTSPRKSDFVKSGVGILATTEDSCTEILKPSSEGYEQLSLYGAAAAERCWGTVLKTIHH